jgi:hypothetical protein
MKTITLIQRSIGMALLFGASILLTNCGGSGSSSGSNPVETQAAAPTVSPNGGAFSTSQTLTVNDNTPGAAYHCTTDGTVPTGSSGACPSTITLSSTSTEVVVNVFVTATGYTQSSMASATFTYLASAATPVITPNGGTYNSLQTVAIAVSDTTSGAVYHCTTDGTQPSASSGACPASVTLSATTSTVAVKVYVSASGYSDSSVSTATFSYVAPPPSVSWNSSSYSVHGPSGSLTVDGSVLTASSPCVGSTTVTVTSTSSDTSLVYGTGQFSYWQASTSGSPVGVIYAGSVLPKDKNPVFTLKATCGPSSSTATLTEVIDAPTIDSVTPTTIKSTSSGNIIAHSNAGKYFSHNNTNFSQFMGTSFGTNSTCNITPTGGATFDDVNDVGVGYGTNNNPLGPFSVIVSNDTDINGNGGGTACLLNGITVVANVIVGTGKAYVVVDPTAGTATVVKNGAATQFKVGSGAGSPVAQGDLVFVPNQVDRTVTEIDTDAMSSQTITTGAEYAPVLMAVGPGSVLVAATTNGDASQGAILALSSGYFSKVADAPYFSDLAIQGQNMLWVGSPKGSTTSEVHWQSLSGGPETVVQLKQPADSLEVMSDSTLLAFHVGDVTALVLDPFTLQTRGSVSFAKGLYGFSGDYATLSDGSIGKVAVTSDGAGNPVAAFTLIDFAEKNYGSFLVDTTSQPGIAKVYSVYYGDGSVSAPRVHVVPMAQ